jgi:hypothetical protein
LPLSICCPRVLKPAVLSLSRRVMFGISIAPILNSLRWNVLPREDHVVAFARNGQTRILKPRAVLRKSAD